MGWPWPWIKFIHNTVTTSSFIRIPMRDPFVCHIYIWCAIYHQHTPVMLASIYHTYGSVMGLVIPKVAEREDRMIGSFAEVFFTYYPGEEKSPWEPLRHWQSPKDPMGGVCFDYWLHWFKGNVARKPCSLPWHVGVPCKISLKPSQWILKCFPMDLLTTYQKKTGESPPLVRQAGFPELELQGFGWSRTVFLYLVA